MKTNIFIDGELHTRVKTIHVDSVIDDLEFHFVISDIAWTGTERVDITTIDETTIEEKF